MKIDQHIRQVSSPISVYCILLSRALLLSPLSPYQTSSLVCINSLLKGKKNKDNVIQSRGCRHLRKSIMELVGFTAQPHSIAVLLRELLFLMFGFFFFFSSAMRSVGNGLALEPSFSSSQKKKWAKVI
ncbi:hypothetical protein D8B26_000352 [Coccidioides posadasii str. Silveira]|uniref:uncharacterized protein n=1 Tax=Coccidioides posadasii (strain RMSCC 757 / Silveira) TaxID=443226 RepID=UPI001BF12419|nr:hypothetical protein D8B26_000352 [Coccidioides posadasii str. Silveira]